MTQTGLPYSFGDLEPSNFDIPQTPITHLGTPLTVSKKYLNSSGVELNEVTISSTELDFVFTNTGLDEDDFTTNLGTHTGTPNNENVTKSYVNVNDSDDVVNSTIVSETGLHYSFGDLVSSNFDIPQTPVTHTGKATSLKSDNNFVLEIDTITNDNGTHTVSISGLDTFDSVIIDPTGVIESFDTSSVTLTIDGLVSFDDDSIEFQIHGDNRQDLYNIVFSVTGYLNYNNDNNDYEIMDQGSGFNGQATPVVKLKPDGSNISLSNPEMIEGKILSVEILNGGRDYNSNNNSITVQKNGSPAIATFTASLLKNGIIEEVEISNGGKDFTLDQEITVGDSDNVRTPTNIKITDIDDNHIEAIELVDPGSGFSLGDQTLNVKDATFSETIDITTSNQHGNPNESILCILDNLDVEITKSD